MLRSLNWSGIAFGAGAGLVLGLVATAIAGGANAPALVQVGILLTAFVVAGYLAGRFSLVGVVPAGGFAALLLYFGLAVIGIVSGADLNAVSIVFFGICALALGSVGAALADRLRRRRRTE